MPNKLLTELHLGQAFFRRLNPNYYSNELRLNAVRRKEKGYDILRKDEIKLLHNKRRMMNKGLPQRKWDNEEVKFLIKYFKKNDYKEIAKELERSTGSIEHKVLRLGLKKNNKYALQNL